MAAQNINVSQFEQAIQEQKPLLVDFWAPWCGYCRRIGPAVEALADEMAENVQIVKVNIDEVPQLAERFQVDVIPTLILFKDGKIVDSVVAPGSKAALEEFIRSKL